ncbi:glutamate synthase [Pandoraea morbifera]|uniref:Glutamate synthase n=1 Tax=Pandoraea morbifera TaxID=2508300 RepID=A0A5E4SIC9_9BURK|nr:glutamate synthase [Pandoraea morbifera]
MFSRRFLALWLAVALLVATLALVLVDGWHPLWPLPFAALVALGVWDVVQQRHAVLRNYPLWGHFRFLFEFIRPEIRQYFVEDDTSETPFSRAQRSIVYQRAKGDVDSRPFGTELDVRATGYEWIAHSLAPTVLDGHDFRITIGPDRAQPYSASIFNISAMSFGALSANAIRALNRGAKLGNFIHDTGEGSISPHHREQGGDLIWEVASGYFGCRNDDGTFNAEKFAAQATAPQVKMIEVKLSQGAKPGHGGVLPAAKITPEISATRGVPMGQDCISPARHSEFSTPLGLLQFVDRLRTLSGGKPTGFKLCIGHPWEFFGIVKAMLESGILPDFIVVDGSEGGTGAAPLEFTDHVGAPLQEGLLPAQHARGGRTARQDPDRCVRQDRDGVRHCSHVGDWRRLVQFRARLHVRDRVHSVAEVPYRPVSDRCRDARPLASARARGPRQGAARASVPLANVACASGVDSGRGSLASVGVARASHRAAGVVQRDSPDVGVAEVSRARGPAARPVPLSAVRDVLAHGARRQLLAGGARLMR